MQSSPAISLSPNSTTQSSARIAEIAARVVKEFHAEADDVDSLGYAYGTNYSFLMDFEENLRESGNDFRFPNKLTAEVLDEEKISDEKVANDINSNEDEKDNDDEDEEEFEFAVVSRDFITSPTPADEIFYNGQIRPYYPLFNPSLLLEGVEIEKKEVNLSDEKSCEKVRQSPAPAARLSLRKLFIEDREPPLSSEADRLDGVQPGSYCVWTPRTAVPTAAKEAGCKKNNSTGSAKRWRFRDLLHRNNSDGKDSILFLTHSEGKNAKKREEKIDKIEKIRVSAPEVPKAAVAAYEEDADSRRMTFTPYRQGLVGFLSNINGLSRNLYPI